MQTMTPQMLDVVQLVHFSQTHGFEALKDTLEETRFFVSNARVSLCLLSPKPIPGDPTTG
jgi:hypothetical protein